MSYIISRKPLSPAIDECRRALSSVIGLNRGHATLRSTSRAVEKGRDLDRFMGKMNASGRVSLLPPTTIERYFSLHYGSGLARRASGDSGVQQTDAQGAESSRKAEGTCVARHHNGICVVCLAPGHTIILRKLQIVSVDFRPGLRPVQGKKKRGGTFLEADSKLATIQCSNGESYTVLASVRGILVETNEELQRAPMLVVRYPLTNGYLAVVLPKPSERATATNHLALSDV
jgi:hypothetical protein